MAARYFVYKLYEATDGQPDAVGDVARDGRVQPATIARAVERGWVVLQEVRGKPLDRKAALNRRRAAIGAQGEIGRNPERAPALNYIQGNSASPEPDHTLHAPQCQA